jgi:hypothetical protein
LGSSKCAVGIIDSGGKFAVGIIDIGGKFATGINNTSETGGKLPPVLMIPVVYLDLCEYLREFSKKFETLLTEYSGAGGKLIHEKNQQQKIS